MEFYAAGKRYQVVVHDDGLGGDVELLCEGKSLAILMLSAGTVSSVILPEVVVVPKGGETVH